MAEFATNTKANTGVTLGSVALGLGVLNTLGNGGNVLGNLFGGCGCNTNNPTVNRYELGLENEIARLRTEVSLRDSNIFTDSKLLDVYKYFDGKIEGINSKLCEQAVFNAAQTSAMNCMGGQIAQLFSLTKLVVPNSSVCPGYGNVTVTPATATTGA